ADLEHYRPKANRMLVAFDIEFTGGLIVKLDEINAGQIARGVIEEHVFAARIARVDAAIGRARVPFINRGIVLNAGIGTSPRAIANVLPKLARLERLVDLAAIES